MVDLRNLCKLSYVNGFNVWSYRAHRHTKDEVCNTGYFNNAADMLGEGDKIEVSAVDGGRSLWVRYARADLVHIEIWG